MTSTWTWPIAADPTGTILLRTLDAQFGDGYAQSVMDGINNKVQNWPVSSEVDDTTAAAIIAFLDPLGGATSFYWTPPLGVQGYYRCKNYTLVPHGAGWNTFTGIFEQRFLP